MHFGTGLFPESNRHIHQFTNADRIETGKRIAFVNLIGVVRRKELAGIVARESEGHLRQVVGAETEEFRFFCDLVCGKRGAGNFDHGADFVFEIRFRSLDHFVRRLNNNVFHILQFFYFARERDHDFGNDVPAFMFLLYRDRRFDDSLGLHYGNFGISNAQTAAAVSHHGVELVQIGNDLLDLRYGLTLYLCKGCDIFLGCGNELVKRRIEETDGYGISAERFEQTFKVCLLHGFDFGKRRFSLLDRIRTNHFAERADSCGIEEHVFGTAKTDPLRAERRRLFRVRRRVRIGTNAERFIFVGKFHNASEIAAVGICGNGRDQAIVNVTRRTVERNAVAFVIYFSCEFEIFFFLVHFDVAATGYAAGTHAARHDCRMRRLSAAHRENSLRILHAFDIFGRGFKTNENDLLALLAFDDSIFGSEYDGTCRRAGGCRDPFAYDVFLVCFFQSLGVELRVQEHVKRFRIDLHQRFLFGNHAFVDQIASDFDRRRRGPFSVTGLEHVKFFVLYGEFHVLHIAVMIFQRLAYFLELLVYFGEYFRHFRNGHGRTYTRNDVFALRVGKEFAHQSFFARSGIARERNARTAVVAHVAERHHLYVDRGTPRIRDVVIHTVDIRTGVVPRTEHRFDRLEQLLFGIGRKFFAELFFILCFKLVRKRFQIVRGKFHVLRNAFLFFHLVDEFFEIFFTDFHDDIREHLNESSVTVVCPAGIARFLCNGFHHFFVQAEVEDSVHHAGHGSARARTDGNEKGILLIAELFAGDLFHLVDVVHNFSLNGRIDLSAVFVILRAGLGGNREALRNRQTDIGHLRKVCTLAAENFSH